MADLPTPLTPDERALAFGPEFRSIPVLAFEVSGGVMCTTVLLNGRRTALIDDPQMALRTYLGGHAAREAMQ